MRLSHIVPYALAILVGQAALEAVPGIVAEREGGMGLGSALIVAQVVQVAGLALGACLAAYLVDRGSTLAALLAGAALFCAGMLAIEMQPMHALSWVVAGLGLAGGGFGVVMTVAFSMAAALAARERAHAIALLLLTPLLARAIIGPFYALGSMALILGSVIVASLAVLGSGLEGVVASEASGRRPLPGGRALVGGAFLSSGVLLTLGGADPSRVSGVLIAGWVGIGSYETLEVVRVAMLGSGLLLMLAAALVLLRGAAGRPVALAVPAIALATLASGGMVAALTVADATGAGFSAARAAVPGVAAASGGAFGIVLGGWWLSRGGEPRRVAIAGGVVLGATTLLTVVALFIATPPPIALVLGAFALVGVGGGLVAVALRLVLADVPLGRRGLAAGAGVVAASTGSVLGAMIGAGEGMSIATGEPGAIAVGSVVMIAAAIGGLTAVSLMPAPRGLS